MRHLFVLTVGLTLLGLAQIPVHGQGKTEPPKKADVCPPGPSFKHLDGQKLVFVVNGVGDSTTLSDNLSDINDMLECKLRIHMVTWCRQDHKTHDFVDQQAQLKAACRIAGWAKMINKDAPGADIYFVGHDAGARIVLAAAEMMPERSVNRIFLIAAGVSSMYDLRPALKASRSGIEHFWSSEDDFLERVVEKRGTSEGARGFAAGRVGFRPPPWLDAKGREAYRNVRQYRWNENLCGNGGHYAWTLKHNMKRCLVPMFFQPDIVCQVVPPSTPPQRLPTPPEVKGKSN